MTRRGRRAALLLTLIVIAGCRTGRNYVSPSTHMPGRLDHIFVRGLTSPHRGAAGTVLDSRGSSDHPPVWAVAILDD
jgi:endonuclease/exonuclease/phosphatase family metal-dependent hydrolase